VQIVVGSAWTRALQNHLQRFVVSATPQRCIAQPPTGLQSGRLVVEVRLNAKFRTDANPDA